MPVGVRTPTSPRTLLCPALSPPEPEQRQFPYSTSRWFKHFPQIGQ